ncbi:MAG: 50S ribosomal protein L11 [Candidatus Aenigmarchaeota archaeon]|nr:50S ribosomal protein L11 [Candidatus Aenigmarchaeota archaeon]
MGEQTFDLLIEGGKATVTPAMGQQLGPLGVNTGEIINQINEKTKELAGIQVPVKLVVDTGTKEFSIDVGTPPVSALVKKELGIDKGSGETGISRVGDLTEDQVVKISKAKFGSDSPDLISQVKGTCKSMGVSIGQGAVTDEEIKKATEKKEEAPVEEEAPIEAPKEEKKEEKKRRVFKGR